MHGRVSKALKRWPWGRSAEGGVCPHLDARLVCGLGRRGLGRHEHAVGPVATVDRRVLAVAPLAGPLVAGAGLAAGVRSDQRAARALAVALRRRRRRAQGGVHRLCAPGGAAIHPQDHPTLP